MTVLLTLRQLPALPLTLLHLHNTAGFLTRIPLTLFHKRYLFHTNESYCSQDTVLALAEVVGGRKVMKEDGTSEKATCQVLEYKQHEPEHYAATHDGYDRSNVHHVNAPALNGFRRDTFFHGALVQVADHSTVDQLHQAATNDHSDSYY